MSKNLGSAIAILGIVCMVAGFAGDVTAAAAADTVPNPGTTMANYVCVKAVPVPAVVYHCPIGTWQPACVCMPATANLCCAQVGSTCPPQAAPTAGTTGYGFTNLVVNNCCAGGMIGCYTSTAGACVPSDLVITQCC